MSYDHSVADIRSLGTQPATISPNLLQNLPVGLGVLLRSLDSQACLILTKLSIVQLLDLGTNPILQTLLGTLETADKTLLRSKLATRIVQIFGGLVQFAQRVRKPLVEILVRDTEPCNFSLGLGEFLGHLLDFGLLGDDLLLGHGQFLLERLNESFALAVIFGIFLHPALHLRLVLLELLLCHVLLELGQELLVLVIQLDVAMLTAIKITFELHVDGFLLSNGHFETVDFSPGDIELHLKRMICGH
ncbi:uncharacterized protein N7458_002245 [Penicillium daleae]|uniref:Uncharacterized protein n=1 Tax=Penicillium daleae TaxID=63821 RepID=A0AAD6CCN0_9EURO|nr:uncharacterized protein N7458_002245 [Penicillium daleae]KAJ5460693.1 hypothetical protein N7458_002245 [Penicillium daleae]